jgi:hypothetical protein
MKAKLTIVLLIFSTTGFLQTGPAGIGNATSNVLWLKADGSVSTTTGGDPVEAWYDDSGNGNSVFQTTLNLQPLFQDNIINGFPAIQFDNNNATNDKLVGADYANLDNTNGLTIFSVVRPQFVDNNARSIIAKRVNVGVDQSYMFFFFSNQRLYLDLDGNNNRFNTPLPAFASNTNYIVNFLYNGTLPAAQRSSIYSGQTLLVTSTESSATIPDYDSPLVIGSTHVTDPRPFGGYIAEIIQYRVALNQTERIVVDNYLSSKYNITLSTNDFYAGDTPINGDFDRQVAGIGQLSATDNHVEFAPSVTGGLGIQYSAGFDDGDYIFTGHNLAVNSGNTLDVNVTAGGPVQLRWNRIWYIDVTNSESAVSANLTFDISDGGMGNWVVPGAQSDYKLLYRAVNSGSWTIVASASGVSGDQISFTYDFNSNADDGYYTIGTLRAFNSPLPVTLIDFSGEEIDEYVQLRWSTASEINNDYFELEHSTDGLIFSKFANVPGAGNSVEQNNYQTIHENPAVGTNFYRLSQVDFDGSKKMEGVVTIHKSSTSTIKIFPNPALNELTIDNIPEETASINCYDAEGKLMFSINKFDKIVTKLNIEHLSQGKYVLQFYSTNGTVVANTKFIKSSK